MHISLGLCKQGQDHQYHHLPPTHLVPLQGLAGAITHMYLSFIMTMPFSKIPSEGPAWASSWGGVTSFRNMSMMICLVCFFFFFYHRFAYKHIMLHEHSFLLMKTFGLGVHIFKLLEKLVETYKSFFYILQWVFSGVLSAPFFCSFLFSCLFLSSALFFKFQQLYIS